MLLPYWCLQETNWILNKCYLIQIPPLNKGGTRIAKNIINDAVFNSVNTVMQNLF